jgi:N-acetylmuramoyl-L-alanine amidase
MNSSDFQNIRRLSERQMKMRRRVRTAVVTIAALNAAALVALLAQGCRQEQSTAPDSAATNDGAMAQSAANPATNSVSTNCASASTNVAVVSSNLIVLPPETNAPVAPPISVTEYAIVKGDTFSALAKRFHVSIKAIIEANPGVNPARLQIGQKIQIQAPQTPPSVSDAAETASTESPAGGGQYTVKPGDTLARIANALGVSVRTIRELNHLKGDRIYVGQVIEIPAKASAPATVEAQVPTTHPPAQAADPK